jgi:predicted transcriptional regulator
VAKREASAVGLSPTEWRVMNVVWEAGETTARRVRERLAGETGWAYTTVKTLLDRLVEKGALAARTDEGTRVYAAAVPRDRARRRAVRDLLQRAFEGAVAPMVHALLGAGRLSERDRKELRRLLGEHDAAERRR